MRVLNDYRSEAFCGPGRIEIIVIAAIWAVLIAALGAGHENGFGRFQAPESNLYIPLIVGGLINLGSFALVAFWLFPAWRRTRQHVGAIILLVTVVTANIVLQTASQSLIIALFADALRGTPTLALAVENIHAAIAIIVLAVLYRALRDAVGKTAPEQRGTSTETPFIVIGRGRSAVRLPASSVKYIQAAGNYLEIGLMDRKRMVYGALKDVTQADAGDRFVRIHRSWVVNLDAVRHMTRTAVRLDDDELPVGASYADDALKAWNRRLGGESA